MPPPISGGARSISTALVSNLMVVLCSDQPASPIDHTGTLDNGSVVERKPILLRIDPAVHDALARWAADDFRSLNSQIEVVLRRALVDSGECPRRPRPCRNEGVHAFTKKRRREKAAHDGSMPSHVLQRSHHPVVGGG